VTIAVRRRFDVDADYPFVDEQERRLLYLDPRRGHLLPNTEVYEEGRLLIRTNSFACKGDEPDSGVELVAVLGDEAAMGSGRHPDSWPAHLRIDGYGVLNAAVDGATLADAARRWGLLVTQARVTCAVMCGGWAEVLGGSADEAAWDEALLALLGPHLTVICTLPSPLAGDLEDDRVRDFVATVPDPPGFQRKLFRFNRFVRDFGGRHGVDVLDLEVALGRDDRPERLFQDVTTLRPEAYEFVASAVRDRLGSALERHGGGASGDAELRGADGEREDIRRQIYTLW
jgi:hypothetical protein